MDLNSNLTEFDYGRDKWRKGIGSDMQGLRWRVAVGQARAGAWLELRLGSGLGSSRSGTFASDPTERKEGGGERGLPPARVAGKCRCGGAASR